jgi:hypothetical protein
VFRELQVLGNQPERHCVNRHKSNVAAFALNAKVHDALATLHIPKPKKAEFLAPDTVIEEGG